MTPKEYLSQYKFLNIEINSKLEQLEEHKALATKISPSTGFGAAGGISDRVGKTVAKIVDLENEINDDIDKLVELKKVIRVKINSMSKPIHRIVLERKFILRNSLEDIAEDIGYSLPQTKRIYKAAIREFEKNDTL